MASKFTHVLLMVFLVELAMYLFAGTGYTKTPLFNLLTEQLGFFNNPIYLNVVSGIGLFAIAAIFVGTFFQFNINAIYASLAALTVTYIFALVQFWALINSQLHVNSPELSLLIPTFIVAPLLIYYVVATMEWIRGNQ